MRIAFFTDTYLPQINGVSKTLEKLGNYLGEQEIEHMFFAPEYIDRLIDNGTVARFKSVSLPFYPECRLTLPLYANLCRIADKFRPDIIHITDPLGVGLTGLRYARERGIPVVLGLAVHGNDVICMDTDIQKIDALNGGELPIHEEGLTELLKEAVEKNKVTFTNSLKTAVMESSIIIIVVGTPESITGDADFSQLIMAIKSVACLIDEYKVIVIKSTVPVGTCEIARMIIKDNLKNPLIPFDVVSNPEFLREGNAIQDFLKPDRIIVGVNTPESGEVMKNLYRTFNAPIILTDTRSSELVKYACNAYLYVINELKDMSGKKIAVLGLSFKAGTNDTRNSPAVHLLEKLINTNTHIHVYDPVVKSLEEPLRSRLVFSESIEDALNNADCLIIMTEWQEFKELDLERVYDLMKVPVLIDTRNIFSSVQANNYGFRYQGIGKASGRYINLNWSLKNIV